MSRWSISAARVNPVWTPHPLSRPQASIVSITCRRCVRLGTIWRRRIRLAASSLRCHHHAPSRPRPTNPSSSPKAAADFDPGLLEWDANRLQQLKNDSGYSEKLIQQ
uniref:Uncharacterized protein n=1 Tax=Leersia perrieri TaxID=77586 RepID=A0A0D9WV23_9ORYZ